MSAFASDIIYDVPSDSVGAEGRSIELIRAEGSRVEDVLLPQSIVGSEVRWDL